MMNVKLMATATMVLALALCLVVGCGEQAKEDLPQILKITDRSPELEDAAVEYDADLSLTANFPLNIDGLTPADLFASYGASHTAGDPDLASATISLSSDKKILTLSGIKGWSGLSSGAGPRVVEVAVDEGRIRDIFENPLVSGTVLWKYSLKGRGVASVYPAAGALNVPTDAVLSATFSENMDASTINTETFLLCGSLVTGTVSYDAGSRTAYFSPAAALQEEHTYTATLSATIRNSRGDSLGSDYSWSFTTADETTPSVSSVTPASGAGSVSPDATVRATFSEDMDASTISSATFTLSSTYGAVSGSVSYDSSSRSVTFTPDQPLQNTQPYTATIASSVADEAGNSLGAAYNWAFTIRDLSVGWTKSINSSGTNADRGYAVANGSVIVTGYITVAGQQTNIWAGKYDDSGNEAWTRTYNNSTANYYDMGYAVAVDGSGNAYVAGYENVSGQGSNVWLRKYDSAGNTAWTKTHNGSGNNNDQANGVVVDSAGNIYVAGNEYSSISSEKINIWVRKYDSAGNPVWTKTHNGAAVNSYDYGNAIALDGAGNVYVAGAEHASAQGTDIWVRKYDSSGNTVWTRTFSGAGNDWDYGNGVAVDDDGNVYVVGQETIVACANSDIWLRKYDSAGNTVWTRTHDGPANGNDNGYAVALDSDGNVYAAGYESHATQSGNVWIRKYDSDGNVIWTKTYNGSASGFDAGYGVSVDGSGNIYVTGSENVTGQGDNIWVRQYRP